MSRTIPGTANLEIKLNPVPDNRMTVDNAGMTITSANYGIYSTDPTPWSLTNFGRSTTTETESTAFVPRANDTVTNSAFRGISIESAARSMPDGGIIGRSDAPRSNTGVQLSKSGSYAATDSFANSQSGDAYNNGISPNFVFPYSTTFTGTINHGIKLNYNNTYNPVTVDSAGAIFATGNYGIYGQNPTAWTLTNFGLVSTTGSLSTGVVLKSGGTVTNATTGATIRGTLYGVDIEGAAGQVSNSGTIKGSGAYGNGAGVQLLHGGTITNGATNNTTALITGGQSGGIYVNGGTNDLVVNNGTVIGLGDAGTGVALWAGGTVENGAPNNTVASITALHNGVGIVGGAGTVINDGTINGSGSSVFYSTYGIYLGSGGTITNGTSGNTAASIIGGRYGIGVKGAAAIIDNVGTIASTTGYVVELNVGGSVTNAAKGHIVGGKRGVNFSDGGVGTLVNYGVISSQTGVAMPSGGATITNAGTIIGTGGGAISGSVGNDLLIVRPGAVFQGTVNADSGTNILELGTSLLMGTLTGIGTQFLNFGSIEFDSGANWFIAGNTAGLGGAITGFALGDTIEATGITATGSVFHNGTLTLIENPGTPSSVTLNFPDLPGNLTAKSFIVTDVFGGTDVSLAAPCFVAGTRIRTERGAIAVEGLQIGDLVSVVTGGGAQPIIWLGHRHVDCRRHPDPTEVWPICLSAGAFGPGRPFRDLWLSPDHALFIGGVLIPIRYLVNGRTIFQEARDEVTYWHVELAKHDVLYAEGVPAESYLDTGNRSAFANGGAVMDLHPDFARHVWETGACAPLVLDGSQLAAAKRRLLARANAVGQMTTDDPLLSVLTNGRKLTTARDGTTWRARLPKTTRNIRLVSRTWIPAHTQADTDDLRTLGVAISRLWLDQCEVDLDSQVFASGWHAREADWRWTDGDAWLAPGAAREVAFEVAMTGTYWRDETCGKLHAA